MASKTVSSVLLVLVALSGVGRAGAAEALAGDLARLQGNWTAQAGPKRKFLVVMEVRGRSVSVVIRPAAGPPIRARGQVRLEPGATPKALDWVDFQGLDGQALPEVLGIYEVDGDTFRVCNGGPHNPRPTGFEPGEGALAGVVTFRRQGPPAAEGD